MCVDERYRFKIARVGAKALMSVGSWSKVLTEFVKPAE